MQVRCRTDYPLATPAIADRARSEHTCETVTFSDDAPTTGDHDLQV